jgi:hypothetical protein
VHDNGYQAPSTELAAGDGDYCRFDRKLLAYMAKTYPPMASQ